MNNSVVLKNKITSCKNLLEVFQKEREVYGETTEISMDHVMNMLQFKKQILEQFEGHKALIQKNVQVDVSRNKIYEKELIRELGALLEQLLVIDMENEKLLRGLLQSAGKEKSPAQNLRMPFVPADSQENKPSALIDKRMRTEQKPAKSASSEKFSSFVNPENQIATGAKKKKLMAYSKLLRKAVGQ